MKQTAKLQDKALFINQKVLIFSLILYKIHMLRVLIRSASQRNKIKYFVIIPSYLEL